MPDRGEFLLLEAALENAEAVVDTLVDSEVLSSLPVVGTAVKMCQAFDHIRNRILAAKLYRLLDGLGELTEDEKQKWRKRVAESPEESRKVGETLLLVIDRMTDMDKPELLGILFLACLDAVIDGEQFCRLARAVDVAYLPDIQRLLDMPEVAPLRSQEAWMRYLAPAWLTQQGGGERWGDVGEIYYELSDLGVSLREAYAYGRTARERKQDQTKGEQAGP